MREFVEVARVDDIPPGTAAVVEAGGTEIALVNVDGSFYALQNECTHAQGPLGEGELTSEHVLECPWHGSCFDVRTGEVTNPPATENLDTYEVRVEEGVVKVAVD